MPTHNRFQRFLLLQSNNRVTKLWIISFQHPFLLWSIYTLVLKPTHLTNEFYFSQKIVILITGSLTTKRNIRYDEDCSYPHSGCNNFVLQ